MLIAILQPNFPPDKPFDESIAAWKSTIDEYEKTTMDCIGGKTKIAVITSRTPEKDRANVLQAAARADGSWAKFEQELQTS